MPNPVRISFQSTPVERFATELAVIRDRIDDLPDAVVRQVLDELDRLRRRTLAEMADATPETFDEYRLQQLETMLRRAMQNFVDHYQTILTPAQQEAYGLGAELVARPLQASGLIVPTPQLSRRQIEAMQGFQARLITNVGDATIGEITTEIRVGLLRGEGVPTIMRRVAGSLTDPGPFGSLALRAEAITRTEIGRIQAMAAQASLQQTQRLVPDLMKEWKHSRNKGKDARDGHIEADGQRTNIMDAFSIRPNAAYPYEKIMFPRDPASSPRNSVNCGCVVVPYRKAWEEFEREPATRRTTQPKYRATVTITRTPEHYPGGQDHDQQSHAGDGGGGSGDGKRDGGGRVKHIDQANIPAKLVTGEPLSVKVFRGTSTGAHEGELGWYTTDPAEAGRYATASSNRTQSEKRVTRHTISVKNPYVTTSPAEIINAEKGSVDRLRAQGYDALAYRHGGGIPIASNPNPTPRVWIFPFKKPDED